MLFIMNVGQRTNRPEGWVRTNRDSVRIVYIWVRNVWVRTYRGYETTGYRYEVLKYCFNGGITFLAETLSFIHFIKSQIEQIEHLLSVTCSFQRPQ